MKNLKIVLTTLISISLINCIACNTIHHKRLTIINTTKINRYYIANCKNYIFISTKKINSNNYIDITYDTTLQKIIIDNQIISYKN